MAAVPMSARRRRRVLADYDSGYDNNFTVLRLLAALLVIWSHNAVIAHGMAALTGDPELQGAFYHLTGISLGRLAVNAFFVMSGFLLARSLALRPSPLAFVSARVLRIYPG